jgi:hypothetical protein
MTNRIVSKCIRKKNGGTINKASIKEEEEEEEEEEIR